jgi:hypothetical protein
MSTMNCTAAAPAFDGVVEQAVVVHRAELAHEPSTILETP